MIILKSLADWFINVIRAIVGLPPKSVPEPSPDGPVIATPYSSDRISWLNDTGQERFTADLPEQRHPIVGFHLSGRCPRCDHDTIGICPASNAIAPVAQSGALRMVTTVVGSVSGGGVAVAQNLMDRLLGVRTTICVMSCECTAKHQSAGTAQAGEARTQAPAYGCGASWLVQVGYRLFGKTAVSVNPVPDVEAFKYWRAADATALAAPQSLAAVQSVASKWQTALTAILSLLGITALVGGRDALDKLNDSARLAVGIAAVVAVATSALASFFFAMASSGMPSMRPLGAPRSLVDSDLTPLRKAWWAAIAFRVAFVFAFLSLTATAVAVRYVWYGGPKETPKHIQVTVDDGRDTVPLCGVARVDATSGSVTITPGRNGAKASRYRLDQIVGIGSC